MKKIGLFGGTFDPIHKAHIEIAEKALEVLSLDKVIFVVAGEPPHKSGDYRIDALHRLNMVNLATADNSKFEVSDYEIIKQGKSYSYQTAGYFKRNNPDTKMYFLIGDDAYRELSTWKHPEKLSALVTFAVFTRGSGEVTGNFIKIDIEPIKISSTQIRERLLKGEDVSDLLPESVINYIKENNLYKG